MQRHVDRSTSLRPSAKEPLVILEGSLVEVYWSDGEVQQRLACEVEEPSPEAVAKAVAELLRTARCSKQILLVLDEASFETLQVFLGDLPDSELPSVFARRAAGALETAPEDVAFWVLPLAQVDPSSGSKARKSESTWIVHAQEYDGHLQLLIHLRQAGVRVRGVGALRDVLPRLGTGSEQEGDLQVCVYGAVVLTHLRAGAAVIQESRLEIAGELGLDGETVLSVSPFTVIQEVRQLAAFWTRASRSGKPLARVTLCGFTEEECEEIAPSVAIAAKGAKVETTAVAADGGAEARRAAVVQRVRTERWNAHDLSLALPPRRARLVAGFLLFLAVGVALAHFAHERWEQWLQVQQAELASSRDLAHDLGESRVRVAAFEQASRELEDGLAAVEDVSQRGLPLEEVLAELSDLVGGNLRPRHLGVSVEGGDVRLLLEGSVQAALDDAAGELARLVVAARASGALSDVHVEPSSRVPDGSGQTELGFTLSALYGGRP